MQGFVAVVFLAVAVISAYGCPDGWESKAGKCYKFVSAKKNFIQAEDHCKEQGGHLACPKSEEENNALYGMAGKERYLYWYLELRWRN